MRRVIYLVFFLALGSLATRAQAATIIGVKGDVQVVKPPETAWQKAEVKMLLRNGDQIKTGKKAECVVAFDEDAKDVMMIKENSQVTIETVLPAAVALPKGRVFSLIKDITSIQQFEIRTPTSTAGVRGSGLGVAVTGDRSIISCFEDIIVVRGLDSAGNVTQEQEITEGYGIDVIAEGQMTSLFAIGDDDMAAWDDFVRAVETPALRAAADPETAGVQELIDKVTSAEETLQDTKVDSLDNARDDSREDLPSEPPW